MMVVSSFRGWEWSPSSIVKRVAPVIILSGIVLRLGQYAANRSLWLDEASLALNIVSRSFVELTQPLSRGQAAPLGFLFMQKTVIKILGNRDYILRLFPLVAGIIALLLIYKVADIYIEDASMLVALGLFAVSSPLIYYASEVKQYSSDVLITLLLLLVACKWLEAKTNVKYFVALVLAGALSLWMSHPALFIVAGIAFSLALDRLVKRDWPRLAWLGAAFFVWSASFAVLCFASLRYMAASAFLTGYWSDRFMPMPPWRDAMWFPKAFATMLVGPSGVSVGRIGSIVFFLVFLIGCFSFFFRNWQKALTLVMPFVFALVASGLHKYPFSDRLLLFILPLAFLLIAEGMRRAYLAFGKIGPRIAFSIWSALAILLLYDSTCFAVRNLWQPYMGEDIKPVISYMAQHKLSTDAIYVYYSTVSGFSYYAPQYSLGASDFISGISSPEEPAKYIQDLNKLSSRGRVWFLFSHNCYWCLVNEETYFLSHLDKIGTRVDEFKAPGASVYAYNLAPTQP
jgi:hypothetical protein